MKNRTRKDKPIFKAKKHGSVLGAIITLVAIAALVFVGYSAGRPIIELIRGDRQGQVTEPNTDAPDVTKDLPTVSQPKTEDSSGESSQDDSYEPEPAPVDRILYISYPGESASDYSEYILSLAENAAGKGYTACVIELVAEGGAVLFSDSGRLANESGAVPGNAIADLGGLCSSVSGLGLTPYARVSLLSDHIVSWYDKSTSYMIEGSTYRWLDDTAERGGKPWLSPFEQGSLDYTGELCLRISQAGFSGLIAGEVEFPPFRSRDLEYIGESVKSGDRHKALTDFAKNACDSFNNEKEFRIELDAYDVISGGAEILSDPEALCTKSLVVRFELSSLDDRITRSDGSQVSFEGLNWEYKLRAAVKLVSETLGGMGVTYQPFVAAEEGEDGVGELMGELGFMSVIIEIGD